MIQLGGLLANEQHNPDVLVYENVDGMGRTTKASKDEKSPYERRYGRPSTSPLVPFGCRCVYRIRDAAKYEPPARDGVVLYPTHHGAYAIMDWKEYTEGHWNVNVVIDMLNL